MTCCLVRECCWIWDAVHVFRVKQLAGKVYPICRISFLFWCENMGASLLQCIIVLEQKRGIQTACIDGRIYRVGWRVRYVRNRRVVVPGRQHVRPAVNNDISIVDGFHSKTQWRPRAHCLRKSKCQEPNCYHDAQHNCDQSYLFAKCKLCSLVLFPWIISFFSYLWLCLNKNVVW